MCDILRRVGKGAGYGRERSHNAGSSAVPTTLRFQSIGVMVGTALRCPCCEAGVFGSRLCPPYDDGLVE